MHKWLRRLLILGIACVVGVAPLVAADNPEGVAIEEQMAARLQRSLDSIYGPNNFAVRVEVSLSSPRYEVRYTQQSKAAVQAEDKNKGNKVNIMPGYPVIRNLAPDNMKQLPFDSVTNLVRPTIQGINVYLVVNKSFPKSQVGRAQAIIKDLMGLKEGRDKITVSYKPFLDQSPPIQKIEIQGQGDKLFSYQNIFYMVFALIAILFMVLYILFAIRAGKNLKAIATFAGAGAGSGGSGGGTTSVSVNPSFELPKGGSGGGDIKISNAPPVKQYFDFVTDDNIEKLIYLLRKENVGPDNLSLIVSFLRPDLAAKLLGQFDAKIQAQISIMIIDQKMVNRAMLDKLETQIKGALECLTGGESSFQAIYSHISSETKKQLLALLEKSSPEGFRKVRNNVVLFDDLKILEDEEIKTLMSETRTELFAVALASVDPAVYDRFDRNMTKNAKDVIVQFLEIRGANIAKEEVERAQQSILEIAMRLERDKKINITGKLRK
ncbi:hypothetical protein EBR96_00555 [bacterium]|nr:hypothetical protein [bacterium]